MNMDWQKLQSRLRRYLGRILRNPEDADELAQEAIVRVLEAGSRGEIRYPGSYLYRTASNLAVNLRLRKSSVLVDYIEEIADGEVLAETVTVEHEVAVQRRFESLCHRIADLPEQCRRVMVLRKVYGYSQKEVAERLGISVSTVEKHLSKALLRCAEDMRTEDNENAGGRAATVRRLRKHQS